MARGGNLTDLAEMIGEGLAIAPAPPELSALGRIMATQGLTGELARAMFAEAGAKRPKTRRIDGLLFLFGEAADELRLSGNGENVSAQRELAAVLNLVGHEAAKGRAGPGMLMALTRTLKFAGLEPPPQVQHAMGAAMAAEGASGNPRLSEARVHAQFDDMAEQFGGDPFLMHQEIAAMAAAFPADKQPAVVMSLFEHANPVVRAAGLGFVLSAEATLAKVALAACAQASERETPDQQTLSRLVMMRPWLGVETRAVADPVIAHLRKQAPEPLAAVAPIVDRCFATPCDGAGVQSISALVKQGRKWALASVLIKAEAGVADAWAAKGMTKREADGLAARLMEEAAAELTTMAFASQRLGDALARHAAAAPPPFGLVQVCELLGLGIVAPNAVAPETLIAELLNGLPAEQTGPLAQQRAHEESIRWADMTGVTDTWFEAGAEVEALLKPIRGRAKREAAVLQHLLPGRRDYWLQQLAWTAAALKPKAGKDPTWIEMALVGRALIDAADMADVPFVQVIAIDTVRAFEGRG